MNLKPRVSSNFSAALIRPRLPSLMRSGRLRPWFWYCFATETTKRRFARVSFSSATGSPLRMRCASSTSSSGVTNSSLPISWRYLSRDALSRLVILFVIFNCLIYNKIKYGQFRKELTVSGSSGRWQSLTCQSRNRRICHARPHPRCRCRAGPSSPWRLRLRVSTRARHSHTG